MNFIKFELKNLQLAKLPNLREFYQRIVQYNVQFCQKVSKFFNSKKKKTHSDEEHIEEQKEKRLKILA